MTAFLGPCPSFRQKPVGERRALASSLVNALIRLRGALRQERAEEGRSLQTMVAQAAIAQELDTALEAWRGELMFAQRQARGMGHGWPASSAGGSGCGVGSQLEAGRPSDDALPYSQERQQ